MTTRTKFIIAGALLFVTGFAISFLLLSFTTTAQATAPAQAEAAAAPVQAQAQPEVQPAQNPVADFNLQASPAPTSTEPSKGPNLKGPGRPGPGGFGGGPFFGGNNTSGPEMQGVISNVTGSKLTINNRTVNTNDQTVVGDANGTLKVADLKQGDRVTVLGKAETDKSLTARWILRLPALPRSEQGTVSGVSASGSTFTFKTRDNTEWTATVTGDTAFNRNGQTAKLSDFQNGDQVVVVGTADTTAHKIEAQHVVSGKAAGPGGTRPGGNFTRGTIKSVDAAGNSLVVTEGQTDVKVSVDSTTRYLGQNIKSLSDLKAGQMVFVQGAKQADGSVKATNIGVGPGGKNGRTGDTNFFNGQGTASFDPQFETAS